MISLYRFILALHIIAVISWMAGLLYLFRLFVYHVEETTEVVKERFKVMEERLLRIITLPAMLATLLFGITMIVMNPALLGQKWLWAKLVLAGGMMFLTHYAGTLRLDLADNRCAHSSRRLRFLNEAPTLLMIFIVMLVILKPF